jgi:AGCS family alanine or glycine:cation symporter
MLRAGLYMNMILICQNHPIELIKKITQDLAILKQGDSAMTMNFDSVIDNLFKGVADFSEKTVFWKIPVQFHDAAGNILVDGIPLVIIWLAAASIFFTFYYGFINFRYFGHAVRIVRGKYDEPGADGQINSFQALAASLAATVGLGNIAGVAVAVSVGGPGAVVWMMIMGFLGMSTKFVEVTAGLKYRRIGSDYDAAEVSGGPMYYLKDAFANRGMAGIGRVLAVFFAITCIMGSLGGGNMFQANQTFVQFLHITGGEQSWFVGKGWLFGIILAVMTGMVIVGGIKGIANVSGILVPVMALVYIVMGLIVIAMNAANIPHAIGVMLHEAFTPAAGLGGFIGAVIAGVQRASFSNEAGLGSAAIIHSAAQTKHPIRQGIAGMLGPFIDTVVICMITALVIVFSGVYEGGKGVEGVELTSRAFESSIPGSRYILAFTVFLFAYSTLIGWFYYGVKGVTYIFGEKKRFVWAFKGVFLCFVVLGCASELENVIRFTDAMFLSMAIPNIIGLYVLAPEIKRDLKNYLESGLAK